MEEKIFSSEEETYHSTELSDMLIELRKNQLNINTVSRSELEKLPWLSENDIEKLIDKRRKTPFSQWSDLAKIEINDITITEMKPYFKFTGKREFNISNISRVEFNESKEKLPSTLKYYQRSLFSFGNYNFGFLSQKDENENNMLDFYSYFAEYRSDSSLKQVILGKYRLAFGQGILFAPKLGLSKSAAATTLPVKKHKPIKPYTSSYEIWEMEGVSAHIDLGKLAFVPFTSMTKLSANLSDNLITSFNETGIHTDENKKDNVREVIFGAAVSYDLSNSSIGAIFSQNEFDHKFLDPDKSSKDYTAGINFILGRNRYPLIGEIAVADHKYAGIIAKKFGEDRIRHLLLFRYYEKDFPTWHGNAFSSQSDFDNEIGLYYGITFLPYKRAKINLYFDVWKFPETRYFEKMPTVGSEQFIQFETLSKNNGFRITLQHKDKEKYKTIENESKIRGFERTLLRADWWQNISDFRFKTRCELITEYLPEEKLYEKGILLYEQLRMKMEKLELIAQITVYHSNVLHYMYENNIDGIMQNSILSGDGIYSYFLLKYKLIEQLEMQFKISDHWFSAGKMRLYLQVVSGF